MDHDAYPDDYVRRILKGVKTIALVGASNNPARPSWIVTKYLSERGYDVLVGLLWVAVGFLILVIPLTLLQRGLERRWSVAR